MLGIRQAGAQDTAQVVGCYLAKPALTYSSAGNLERGDSSWSHAKLSADGKAQHPLLRRDYDVKSVIPKPASQMAAQCVNVRYGIANQ